MLDGMIGRKLGMVSLYTPDGRARACTAIELGPNWVTQVRSMERDGYEAVQLGFSGARKRVNRPERGHLRRAGVDTPLTRLREFAADEVGAYALGQQVPVTEFVPGEFVHVTGVSKGRGFAGGVKRWHFRGGPKTHGQSDRHRAPGSVGAGTTPGRTWRGQKMAGHMGARQRTVMNLLVIAVDEARGLLFVEGSVPGATNGLITVTRGRRKALANFAPAELRGAAMVDDEVEAAPPVDEAEESEGAAEEPSTAGDVAEAATESEGNE